MLFVFYLLNHVFSASNLPISSSEKKQKIANIISFINYYNSDDIFCSRTIKMRRLGDIQTINATIEESDFIVKSLYLPDKLKNSEYRLKCRYIVIIRMIRIYHSPSVKLVIDEYLKIDQPLAQQTGEETGPNPTLSEFENSREDVLNILRIHKTAIGVDDEEMILKIDAKNDPMNSDTSIFHVQKIYLSESESIIENFYYDDNGNVLYDDKAHDKNLEFKKIICILKDMQGNYLNLHVYHEKLEHRKIIPFRKKTRWDSFKNSFYKK